MSPESELDRSEAATPYKLGEARKRGQVARSPEFGSAVALTTAFAYLYAKGWESLVELFRFDRVLLGHAGKAGADATSAGLWHLVERSVADAMALVLPGLAVVMVASAMASLLQTGAVLSLHPVKPDWQRINPAHGFKRLLSARTLFDAVRACIKLAVLCGVAFFAIAALMPRFRELSDMTPSSYLRALVDVVASLGFQLGLALLVLAAIDVAYSRREFARKMRMSRRELRDEFKHREGDPRIRARMREIRRELLKRSRALQRTSQADVVVTNPTHVAVALRYRHGEMGAPVIVSKGAGALAAAIRVIAARRQIPVVRHPSLARALYRQGSIDLPIPTDQYADVARIMVWLLSRKDLASITDLGRAGQAQEASVP